MKCDGFIVDYKLGGTWKHQELVIGLENESLLEELPTECAFSIIVSHFHEIKENNTAVVLRIHNWNKDEKELERLNNENIRFEDAFRGYLTEFYIVNEELYKEWLKPEKVM